MNIKTLACAVTVFGSALLGGCFNPLPAPRAVTNQALGGPCTGDADCSAGLGCRSFLATGYPDGSSAQGEASSLCTTSCGATACAAGSVCLTASGHPVDAGTDGLCVPTCAVDGDCQRGVRAQICSTVADAGSRVCQFLECGRGGSSACSEPNIPCGSVQCPAGFSCVAQPSEYGFCQRQ